MYKLVPRSAEAVSAWLCPEGMPSLIHRLLMQRGISSPEEAQAFLHPEPMQLHDPMLLSGMKCATGRILAAMETREPICIYGDYDVDGVSACSVMLLYLRAQGADVRVYIPSRHGEGYGLNERAVREIAKDCTLLITVDCGISCKSEVALARELGMDVIVTDHHRPGDQLPDCTLVNPLLGDYPFPSLCGAGVAFKLVMALCAAREEILCAAPMAGVPAGFEAASEYIDLAALATVADIVPLTGENRVIVKLGLARINERPRPGIAALIQGAGLQGKTISAGHIGFQLAPRLNAGGRLGDARRAMNLLTAEDGATAAPIAEELEHENSARREEQDRILSEALGQMEHYDLLRHRAIVLVGAGWNEGVIGLAASHLQTRYHYPVVLLAEHEGVCVGSCRSIPGVDIFAALSSCGHLMTRYGGHRQAAGLTIDRDRVDQLIACLDEYLWENVSPDEYIPELEYDLKLTLSEVTEEATRQLELLQPFGFGNPAPVIQSEVLVESARAVGRGGAHLQPMFSDEGMKMKGIFFGAGARAGEVIGTRRQALYAPTLNTWQNQTNVEAEVKALPDARLEEMVLRFITKAKYARFLRTYLTEILYNIELNSPYSAVQTATRNMLADWLRESPQGTAVAVATGEGAGTLMEFLRGEHLVDRLDGYVGDWGADERAFNGVFLCPCGETHLTYRQIVLWDAPIEAFPTLPLGTLYQMVEAEAEGDWPRSLPGRDRLRDAYLACRELTRSGAVLRGSGEEIDLMLAQKMGGSEVEAMAALAVLRHMGLIDGEPGKLRLMPPKKCEPEDDALQIRLQTIYRHSFKGKG